MTITAAKRVKEFPNSGLEVKAFKLWCSKCKVEIEFKEKTTVARHLTSNSHKKWIVAEKSSSNISLFTVDNNKQWDELAQVFVESGIPFNVLENQNLRTWISKYVSQGHSMPSRTTFRRKIVTISESDLNETKKLCSGKDVCMIVDETTDPFNRKVLNILVTPLEPEANPRLMVTAFIDECNSKVIVEAVVSAVKELELQLDNLVVLLTDNAPYMISAGKKLRIICEKLLHSTCWAHVLHLVSEEVRGCMPNADSLISLMKTALLKCPSRIEEFKEALRSHNKNIKLPPKPVLTRWTTWLQAGSYHWEHFDVILSWIRNSKDTGAGMKSLKDLLKMEDQLAQKLERIHQVFPGISTSIRNLETRNILASEVWSTLELLQNFLISLGISSDKLNIYLSGKHPSHEFWQDVQILDPKKCTEKISKGIPISLTRFSSRAVTIVELLKYKSLCDSLNLASKMNPIEFWKTYSPELPVLSEIALKALSVLPSTSDVERSFSYLKKLLSPQRMSFTEESIAAHLRITYNSKLSEVPPNEQDEDEDDDE